jgi:hypothetical protein
MNFIINKLNEGFTFRLVACNGDEKKFLESHIGEIVELSSRPTPLALDLALPPAKDDTYKIEWLDDETVRLTPSQ